MKKFNTIPEAFEWWLKNGYPHLPADVKKADPFQHGAITPMVEESLKRE